MEKEKTKISTPIELKKVNLQLLVAGIVLKTLATVPLLGAMAYGLVKTRESCFS